MENLRLTKLFNLAIEKSISSQERIELNDLMSDPKLKDQVETLFAEAWVNFIPASQKSSKEKQKILLQRILNDNLNQTATLQNIKYWSGWFSNFRIAATIVLISGMAIYFYIHSHRSQNLSLAEAIVENNIIPGTKKAILTLGNGHQLVLDSTRQGVVAQEADVEIHKSADGSISYETGHTAAKSEALTYNSIVIPRGAHYNLTLPDGTKVHLNSESSLKYPSKFKMDVRNVELIGEAYFQVAHNEKQPFYVKTAHQVTKVLGTEFTISAYRDAVIFKTILVNGSVKVTKPSGQSVLIRPGQVAINDIHVQHFSVETADLDESLAWHNGYFLFTNEGIQSIMKKVGRWYDVDVEYKGDVSDKKFGGVFQRSKSLTQLLDSFKQTGIIDFKIEGRRVIVIVK